MCSNIPTITGTINTPYKQPVPSKGAATLVQVTISCQMDVSLLPFPGLPNITVTATAFSPLDAYRYHGLARNSG